jgi:hypothetical protein
LNAKIQEAEQAKVGVRTSETNGSDIPVEEKWVTQAVYTAFESAITAAKGVAAASGATQAEVDTALASLVTALSTFKTALADGTDTGTLPWLVRAVVEDGAADIVQVEFSEAIEYVDIAKFQVLVNNIPLGNNHPALSSGAVPTAVTKAEKGATGNGKIWKLTMEAPAKYGEILRLEAMEADAAKISLSGAGLPRIRPLIIRNAIKRQKFSYENTAGFYVNGTKQSTAVDGSLLQNALNYMESNVAEKTDQTWVVVLDTNQTIGTNRITGGDYPGSTLIITNASAAATDNVTVTINAGNHLTSRNELTIILGENVTYKSGTGRSADAMIRVMDAGKLILDGAEISGSSLTTPASSGDTGALIRIGGGSNAPYFIINSGKITGNSITNDTGAGNAVSSIIGLSDYGVVVMHGGEISNNTVTGSSTKPLAGAISSRIDGGAGRNQNNGIFITGGDIKNNTVTKTGADTVATSGAILMGGVFQKTGGTIEGNSTSADNGNVKAGQIAVIIGGWTANPDATNALIQDADAGPDVQLIVDCTSTGGGTETATFVKADWLPDNWE